MSLDDLSTLINACKDRDSYLQKKELVQTKHGIDEVHYCPFIPYKWRKQERVCSYQGLPIEVNNNLHYKCINKHGGHK